MTRDYKRIAECPRCGYQFKEESPIKQWIRHHPELESDEGFTAFDHDLVWHKWRTTHGREVQFMMIVELKTHGADLTDSQHDSMIIANQLLRNRRQTPTEETKYQAGTAPLQVFSPIKGTQIAVRHFGVHLWQLEGATPDDSDWMKWDRKDIGVETLLSILKYELDPDTLRPMDCRSHHRQPQQNVLFSLHNECSEGGRETDKPQPPVLYDGPGNLNVVDGEWIVEFPQGTQLKGWPGQEVDLALRKRWRKR